MKRYQLLFIFVILSFALFAFLPANAQPKSPNVVIILADDLGYADVGTYGAPKIDTPHIDKLASQGMKFTEFYAENLCSPSRAALLTGSYARRVGVSTVFWPDSDDGLNPDEITIAELLQEEGYATAAIGKWHLGHKKPFLPTSQGFDYYFGLPFSNDMGPNARPAKGPYDPLPVMRNEEVIERGPDQQQLTKRYTEETVQFIEEHKNKPFFVYLAHTMPHVPLHASQDFRGTSDFGLYGDVVEEIDWEICKPSGWEIGNYILKAKEGTTTIFIMTIRMILSSVKTKSYTTWRRTLGSSGIWLLTTRRSSKN
ncbi:Sulfatase [Fodinibius roseus]|uniref:Sulfatase n=1 Tax=Fodinibius roseus TaxID=1194090 RepID=A0A1M5I3M6_9BACT|nr:sulfatase-like hydrolase/transferase [Fodinibius roseus]SHG22924.1 Sulfatase [Fodinibius roseus]